MSYQYLPADEMIKSTRVYGGQPSSAETPLHVAWGIDQNFLFGCGVSITSILQHNPAMAFVFHVFIDAISDADARRFAELADRYQTTVEIHIVNCERLKAFPTTKNWSVAMYFRFVIGDYFIGRQEKILYLDADIVCKGDIRGLAEADLMDCVAGAVAERDAAWWAIRADSLDCPALAQGYFNSGVLLIDIRRWQSEHVSGKAMEMLSDSAITRRLSYMDQDILNMILLGKVRFLDGKYNTQFSLNYELKPRFVSPITAETVLIHYVGPTKPWHAWACYPSAQPFMAAKAASPWQAVPLMKPGNSNYARYCAKHNFKQRRPLAGVLNYLYYFYLKIVK
ncbi:lipopolysaccharide 3-alpha-galactosyltransferase [Pluralibacter gergoviae]|uniref:Lipopolysaccharide 3-alpha-galactosyltransferase n=1 Tax=Pluralibacter gergoviae TaxID=61647 RepID=A0AAI9DJW2_PLUGE|nr:lipopolysaccharide 3-alpha-galactosyltransferase [Pluralibacter gergoviae]EKV0914762.1 lipopolysaccharide 3-alpha-galactosyltransferase [Pluralibacter gergoviae]EKV9907558.1 lipopolysaccharide 3-alpha-galactosyltransferase [Pluralibacter gergoviae]ELD4296156.1 lipopolysaccharide 3-alpha-galactosyltransferase [Pluralibacter gergoviae]ELD4306657.1 lipopolysaccharide 3-alpha-galactosyltransferase [Pluralibacter gergoviae]ELD4331393.1 lipopolysaccharide 3-alpha-galactosyltransferase [Pluralibac